MKNPTMYIGLDVHKKMTQACVLDEGGDVLLENRFPSNAVGVEYLVKHLPEGERKTAVEASSCAYPMVDLLQEQGFDVSLAHPLGVKWISGSEKKTDKVDAYKLADLSRRNSLPTAYIPSKEVREVRWLVREHIQYTKQQTTTINQARRRMGYCSIQAGHKLKSKAGKKELHKLEDHYLQRKAGLLDAIGESIKEVDGEIHEVFKKSPQAQTLAELNGVGEYSAVLAASEIADINRFQSPKKLCAYAGLVPTISQSGEKTHLGETRKKCNRRLKNALIECAQTAVRFDPRMREHYLRLEPKIGANKAIVAVARRMLTLMYWKLKNQQTSAETVSPVKTMG